MTEGNIPLSLINFAIPLMLASVLQVLYGAIDLFVIGLFSTREAISALANGTQFMHIVMGVVMGLTVGGTVLIGFHVGEKNPEGTAQAIGTQAVLFGLIALVLTPILAFFTPAFVQLTRIPAEAVPEATRYIFICSLGIPFIIGYNVVSAIYRGLGDSRTPLVFVAFACVLNIIVDFLFIGSFRMGAAGAAWATVLSQGASFFLALFWMRRQNLGFRLARRHFRLEPTAVKKILWVGTPLALQDSLISVSFMIILGIVNTMGLVASASVGVSGRCVGFFFVAPVSFAGAVATMTSQNLGAKKPRRALLGLGFGIAFALFFGVSTWAYCQIAPETITRIFTHDVDVVKGAAQYLRSFTFDCLLVCVIFNLNSYFSGCGRSVISMVHSLLSTFGVRVPLAWWISCQENATLYQLGFAAPAATMVSILIAGVYFVWLQLRSNPGNFQVINSPN